MTLKIIPANERMAEKAGVKALILGPYGIGKTSLLRTLDPKTTLFIDGERGDLAVQDVPADTMRPDAWPELRHLAAYIGGANAAFPPGATYGTEHYQAAVDMFGGQSLAGYETIFVDSITKFSRLALQWAQQQPDAFNSQGKPDLRSAYGILGREMISWVTQLQHVSGVNVIFTCAMEQSKDDFGRLTWDPHLEGTATGRALPGIVDEVISYALLADEEGGTYRAFVTQKDNEWGFPAKDRSGRLDPIEEPHLGKLIAKASDEARRRAAITTTITKKTEKAT